MLDQVLSQISRNLWNLRPEALRERDARLLERILWDAMLEQQEASRRKVYFEAFVDIVPERRRPRSGISRVVGGERRRRPATVGERPHRHRANTCSQAAGRADVIVETQIARTENPDNVRKLRFIAPSLSADPRVRDTFFESLADETNGQTESWVLDALANLHHPSEIADPRNTCWRVSSYWAKSRRPATSSSRSAGLMRHSATIVPVAASAGAQCGSFLAERPNYNQQLRMKIEQSAHMLFRANALLAESGDPTTLYEAAPMSDFLLLLLRYRPVSGSAPRR